MATADADSQAVSSASISRAPLFGLTVLEPTATWRISRSALLTMSEHRAVGTLGQVITTESFAPLSDAGATVTAPPSLFLAVAAAPSRSVWGISPERTAKAVVTSP